MNFENLQDILVNGLIAVALGVVGYLVMQLKRILNEIDNNLENEINKIEDEETRRTLKEIEDEIESLIVDSINFTEEHLVKGIKELNNGEKLTKEQSLEILKTTANRVYEELSYQTVSALEEIVTDIDIYLENKTQTVFNKLKNGKLL